MLDYTIEICAPSYESALAAQRGGAARIELCSELDAGGVTPSYGLIQGVRAALTIAVNVLVRPRSGDFLYSSYEVETVVRDIALCAQAGVQGVVVGEGGTQAWPFNYVPPCDRLCGQYFRCA